MDYKMAKIKRLLKRTIIGGIISSAIISLTGLSLKLFFDVSNPGRNKNYLMGAQLISKTDEEVYGWDIYNCLDEAKRDLEKEKKKIGLEDIAIELELKENPTYIDRLRGSERAYTTFQINGLPPHIVLIGDFRNRWSLRHELYHVKQTKDHGFSFYRQMSIDLGVEEWNATSYAISENEE